MPTSIDLALPCLDVAVLCRRPDCAGCPRSFLSLLSFLSFFFFSTFSLSLALLSRFTTQIASQHITTQQPPISVHLHLHPSHPSHLSSSQLISLRSTRPIPSIHVRIPPPSFLFFPCFFLSFLLRSSFPSFLFLFSHSLFLASLARPLASAHLLLLLLSNPTRSHRYILTFKMADCLLPLVRHSILDPSLSTSTSL